MEEDLMAGSGIDIKTQEILLASAQHDYEKLRALLRSVPSAQVQDTETLFTPLHAAIAAFEEDQPKSDVPTTNGTNGHVEDQSDSRKEEVEIAVKVVRLILQNGAIWNTLDANNETPGCIARRLGINELYEVMVDAGVRAEMLLNRLDEYERLQDADDDDEDEDEVMEVVGQENPEAVEGQTVDPRAFEEAQQTPVEPLANPDVTSGEYLQSNLTYDEQKLLDDDANGVMMAWETDIMRRTAEVLLPKPDLRVLNVGFGMGIVDGFFQERSPKAHHIIEAHPQAVAKMKGNGWDQRPGVVIHEGKWQDVIPKLLEQGEVFDAIYFDTFAEDYSALKSFFEDSVIGLLDEKGIFGFFHGQGGDRQIAYDVYTKLIELDLFEAGYEVDWETLKVEIPKEEWHGTRHNYFSLSEYKLPICRFFA
jgi:protein arginine N-methyltransferase 2